MNTVNSSRLPTMPTGHAQTFRRSPPSAEASPKTFPITSRHSTCWSPITICASKSQSTMFTPMQRPGNPGNSRRERDRSAPTPRSTLVTSGGRTYPARMLQAALNGRRTRSDHEGVPITPAELQTEALACGQAGAQGFHVHARDEHGHERLDPQWVDAAANAVHDVSRWPVSVSTGAWMEG